MSALNPIVDLFNTPDGTGLELSDYTLVFEQSAFFPNPGAWFLGTFLTGGVYYLIVTIFAPLTWLTNFITSPQGLAEILTNIGAGLLSPAFRIVSPLGLSALALMLLVFRYGIMPRREKDKKKQDTVRYLGKTSYKWDSTVLRSDNHGSPERKKTLDALTSAFVLAMIVGVFTMHPFVVVQTLMEWSEKIVADISQEQGGVVTPMFAVLRGITWLINFGGFIPEACIDAWSSSMTSGDPDIVAQCLPADQAASMDVGVGNFVVAVLCVPVMYALFKFTWVLLRNITWFLAVVIWRGLYIPYLALKRLFMPGDDRGILGDILPIFQTILTYFLYFLGTVFLAALLPNAILGAMSNMNWHPTLQIIILGVIYYLFARYVIPNIKPGGALFKTTMPGTAVIHSGKQIDGWGDWRQIYWEDPAARPAQLFDKAGLDGMPLSPAWASARRAEKAAAEKKEGTQMLSQDDIETVDTVTETVTLGSPPAATATATPVIFGDGESEPVIAPEKSPAAANTAPTPGSEDLPAAAGDAVIVPAAAGALPAATASATALVPVGTNIGRHRNPDETPTLPAGARPIPAVARDSTDRNWKHYSHSESAGFGASHTDHPNGRHLRADDTWNVDGLTVIGTTVHLNGRTDPTQPRVIDGQVIAVSTPTAHVAASTPTPAATPPADILSRLTGPTSATSSAAPRATAPDPLDTATTWGAPSDSGASTTETLTFGGTTPPGQQQFFGAPDARTSGPQLPQDASGTGPNVMAAAAAQRAHLDAIERARAAGEPIHPVLSDNVERGTAIDFDAREPDGISFGSSAVFNDRI
ncbi:hypothetical protein MUG78_17150 [Gordonia alkaliphila]|uniref:hypothetical protein n=1 Tax=Gordonia alkaliphila TaxID=1053547 RepID=UPI001FF31795|nr:hypothetical protein [Gordonia alkaliphila]MCK0441129.1 hypothetical protein [Gordonia alkaliphila]